MSLIRKQKQARQVEDDGLQEAYLNCLFSMIWRREWDSKTRCNVHSTTCRASDDTKSHGKL